MRPASDNPPDYERVRAQLVERGYLGGPVGRFMFTDWARPSGRRRSGWWWPALRAAVLGAPLLSALLAVTVARANRPLVGAADFPLLWLYFAPIAAVFLFVLDACVAWLNRMVSRLRGAREGEATRAALVAFLPTLAYLVGLMRWHPREGSILLEALFLALAVATLVAVSWLAGLVSIVDTLRRTGEVVGRRGRSLRTLVLVVVLAMLVAVLVRGLRPLATARVEDIPGFETGDAPPLVVVGVDGLDGEWIESLAPGGAVDGLLDWMEQGTVVPLTREPDMSPPEAWTTMLTGVRADLHGVRGIGAERVPGVSTPLERSGRALPLVEALGLLLPTRTVPVTGAVRRVRTVWEIVGLRRATLSIGAWGSWPAESDGGGGPWVVSDRVLPKLLSGAGWDRDTWPPGLFDQLAADFDGFVTRARETFAAQGLDRDPEDVVWQAFLIDAFSLHAAQTLWRRGEFRGAFAYLPGLDILRTRLAPTDAAAAPEVLRAARVFEAYTRWLDGAIIAWLDGFDRGITVVLVTDPGRAASRNAEGLFVVRGDGVPPGCVEGVTSSRAVAPLLLGLAGFPPSRPMEVSASGRRCLPDRAPAGSVVDGYGWRAVETWSPESDYDPEMLERLKSLGYLN